MEQTNTHEPMGNDHKCKTGCCNVCCNCACHTGANKGYWMRRFLILIVGIVLAFWCGYQLGMMKGFIISEYGGGAPYRPWMMERNIISQ